MQQAAEAGIAPRNLRLPNDSNWARFAQTWNEASEAVSTAHNAWYKRGRSIAIDRFKNGRYEEILYEESQRVDGGFPAHEITQKRHADEWVALKMLGRAGGGQRFLVVRMMPGEESSYDEATHELRLAERTRRDAMSRILQEAGLNK